MPLESSTKPHRGQSQGSGEKEKISQGTRYPLLKHGFCGSLKSRRRLHKVPQDGTCNVCQDILRNASHGANRVAFNVANFAASDVASRDYHLVASSGANRVAKSMPTIC
jgi:hypothetical protein